jgi:hypothetical protein
LFSYRIDFVDQCSLKDFSWINLGDISIEESKIIINEVQYWDSSVDNKSKEDNYVYYNTNKEAIDKLVGLATLCGYRTVTWINRHQNNRVEYYIGDNKNPVKKIKTCYAVSFVKTSITTYPHREEVDYKDKVYCVTVPDGNIVVRRHGRVAISGNCVHQRAYALLNDTLGLPDSEYSIFLEYKEMLNKVDFMRDIDISTPNGIALALVTTVLNEGVSLFASFAMLLNYQRFGKMKGTGTIVEWSLRDEEEHVQGMSKLFLQYLEETPSIQVEDLKKQTYTMCRKVLDLESLFIDLVYEQGEIEGLSKQEIKDYVKYIIDFRLHQMNMEPLFGIDNPLPWVDWIVNGADHSNFFEKRVTEYSAGGLEGQWEY